MKIIPQKDRIRIAIWFRLQICKLEQHPKYPEFIDRVDVFRRIVQRLEEG